MIKKQVKILQEIKNYFNNMKDEDYMIFNDHPLSNTQDLMDDSRPAPWDHLTNTEDDEDVDIDITENILK
jgi:hypothetical protein